METVWVRVEELARRTGLAVKTLRKLQAEGLPHAKVGRAVVFPLADVDQWLRVRMNTPTVRTAVKRGRPRRPV